LKMFALLQKMDVRIYPL